MSDALARPQSRSGGITNYGTMILSGCLVSSNSSSIGGGGIDNASMLTISKTTISNNAGAMGGGLYASSSDGANLIDGTIISNTATTRGGIYYQGLNIAESTLTRSAVISNTADTGAGAFVDDGSMTLINTTLSGDRTTYDEGGAIYQSGGIVAANNCTIAHNRANAGGDVYYTGGTFSFRNTIIGANINTDGQPSDCSTPSDALDSQDYNLIENTIGCSISGLVDNNLVGVNPNLGPLQNNGGPTLTHALLASSPAIDIDSPMIGGASNSCASTDQRGYFRPIDGGTGNTRCDIGAFEFASLGPPAYAFLPLIVE